MADYWKSNERKYCDFCKCWMADNKISVTLHETGKRHKDNVAKRITAINKKTTYENKIQQQVDNQMGIMERKAMAAYLKDIALSQGDLTSQMLNEKLAETKKSIPKLAAAATPTSSQSNASKLKTKWQQAKAEDGSTYYWNTDTNDVSWGPPAEGYISLADLEKPEFRARLYRQPPSILKKGQKPNKKPKNPSTPAATPVNKPNEDYKTSLTVGPLPAGGNPYGKWETVEPAEEVDLQLPEQRPRVVAPTIKLPKEKEYKEKQISTLEDDGEASSVDISFKKRKLGGTKRNVRQRLDDD